MVDAITLLLARIFSSPNSLVNVYFFGTTFIFYLFNISSFRGKKCWHEKYFCTYLIFNKKHFLLKKCSRSMSSKIVAKNLCSWHSPLLLPEITFLWAADKSASPITPYLQSHSNAPSDRMIRLPSVANIFPTIHPSPHPYFFLFSFKEVSKHQFPLREWNL